MTRIAALAAAVAVGACGGSARKPTTGARPPEADGPPVALADLKGPVTSVEVVGLSGERAAQARAAIKSKGAPLDRQRVADDVRALWAFAGIEDVVVDGRPSGSGVALRFTVREAPRVRSIDVRGSTVIPAPQWLANLPIKEGDAFDPAMLAAIVERMAEELKAYGHLTAKVGWTKNQADKGRVDVVVLIEEGPAVTLAKVEFRGNKNVKREKLIELLGKGKAEIGARYWRRSLEDGLLFVSGHYFDNGFVALQIQPPEETLSSDGASMTIVVPITEGDQFRVGKVTARGTLVAPEASYVKLLGVKEGEIFNRGKVAKGLEKIAQLHRDKGQAQPEVNPLTELDTVKKRVNLTVEVAAPRQP